MGVRVPRYVAALAGRAEVGNDAPMTATTEMTTAPSEMNSGQPLALHLDLRPGNRPCPRSHRKPFRAPPLEPPDEIGGPVQPQSS